MKNKKPQQKKVKSEPATNTPLTAKTFNDIETIVYTPPQEVKKERKKVMYNIEKIS